MLGNSSFVLRSLFVTLFVVSVSGCTFKGVDFDKLKEGISESDKGGGSGDSASAHEEPEPGIPGESGEPAEYYGDGGSQSGDGGDHVTDGGTADNDLTDGGR